MFGFTSKYLSVISTCILSLYIYIYNIQYVCIFTIYLDISLLACPTTISAHETSCILCNMIRTAAAYGDKSKPALYQLSDRDTFSLYFTPGSTLTPFTPQVQKRVRDESIKLTGTNPQQVSGQVPISFSTLTNLRKLYLFPGHRAPRQRP